MCVYVFVNKLITADNVLYYNLLHLNLSMLSTPLLNTFRCAQLNCVFVKITFRRPQFRKNYLIDFVEFLSNVSKTNSFSPK